MSSTTTGSGELAWRLVIERSPVSWVSHSSMINTGSDPLRYAGLSLGGKIKHIINPLTMESEVGSISVTIADLQGLATETFAKRPTLSTWMTADMASSGTTAAATTLTVRSTAGWPSSGTVWVDSEAIKYTSITTASSRFNGCSTANRGAYSSQAQKHYVFSGGYTRYPEVTNKPVTLAGARAWLYRYEATDDPQGNGTIYWRGIITRDPSFDGASWTFSIEPLTSLLDRSMNADTSDALQPRGAYYPDSFPFRMGIRSAFTGGGLRISLPGFFENNAEFVAALNALVTAGFLTANALESFVFVADGDTSWHIEMRTGTTGIPSLRVYQPLISYMSDWVSLIDPAFNVYPTNDPDNVSVEITSLSPGTAYYWMPNAATAPGAGGVPRGYFGHPARTPGVDILATYPPARMYFAGSADISTITYAIIEWKEFGRFPEAETQYTVQGSPDVSSRHITFQRRPDDGMHGFVPTSIPEIRFGRDYGTGSLGTMLKTIVDAVPDGLNVGAVPPLRADDFEQTLPSIFPITVDRIVNSRSFTSFGDATLMDIIKPECMLAGYALGLTSTGKLNFFYVTPPVVGAILTGTPTTGNYVIGTPTGDPQWSAQTRGTANQVMLARGYKSDEDDYTLSSVTVRDVAAFGQSPRPFTVKIEPKSTIAVPETFSEIVEVARRIFSLFAYPYYSIRVSCDFRYLDRKAGDVVFLTTPRIPDTTTGTMGVSGLPMLVLGREVDHRKGEVTLYGVATNVPLSPYTPSFVISSETNVSGNIWDLTLNPGTYTTSDFFSSADSFRVRAWEFDGTGTPITGTVTSVSGNVVRVSFDASAAAVTAGLWYLGWAQAVDNIVSSQQTHAYQADSGTTIDVGPSDIPSKVFA